jgi:ribosomal protein S15P/S13E
LTLREEIYHQLRSAGLVSCAEDFSQRYLTRNRNWYAHQRFHGRDFSIGAAIACLRNIHAQQRDLTLASVQLRVLTATAGQLQNHLFTTYGITDVA